MILRKNLLYLFILISFIQCKKKDKNGDVDFNINWIVEQPTENNFFQGGDTIRIVASVNADETINSIEIQLQNQDRLKVSDRILFEPKKKEFQFEGELILNYPNLITGKYFISFKATTENGSKHEFVEIYINEGATEILDIFYISENGGKATIFKRDSSKWIKFNEESGDVYPIHAYNKSELLVYGNVSENSIKAINSNSGNKIWEKGRADLGDDPQLNSLTYDGSISFFTDLSRKIYGYNENGQAVYSALFLINHTLSNLAHAREGSLVITSLVDNFNGNNKIVSYTYPTGQENKQTFLGGKVLYMFPHSKDQTIIVNLSGSEIITFLYNNKENNLEFQKATMPATDILGALQLDDNHICLLTKTNLIKVDVRNMSINNIITTPLNTSGMYYEKISNVLWLGNDKGVHAFDANSGGPLNLTLDINEPISNLIFKYNK